jgi:dolichol-phosphate mannosyltransferase
MEQNCKFALVVPALHEARNLEQLLPRVCAALAACSVPWEILVIDDDSRDGTEAVVQTVAAFDSRVRVLVRTGERGLSGAILHGWQKTDATVLGVMDADLQHPPELLPELLAESLNGADVVIGSRYARNGQLGSWNPVRRLISAVAVWVTLPLQRRSLRVKDPMSGFFLVRRRCVENILFQQGGFKLLLEILVRGRIHSTREVPFAFGRRRAGRSKATLKVAWEYFLLLIRLYTIRWGRRRVVEIAPGD